LPPEAVVINFTRISVTFIVVASRYTRVRRVLECRYSSDRHHDSGGGRRPIPFDRRPSPPVA
jgi:hypothetical protein